jgi:hypothetical protein
MEVVEYRAINHIHAIAELQLRVHCRQQGEFFGESKLGIMHTTQSFDVALFAGIF